MPYVAVAGPPRTELLAIADRRWEALLAERPDLSPAIDLQRRLLTRVLDLALAVESGRLPRLSLPPKYLAAKLARGVPALAGEPIPLPTTLLRAAVIAFCGELASGGAGEVATHIGDAVASGRIDPGSLLTSSLAREQDAIRQGAIHLGLAPDLVWLVAELAVGPVAYALQRVLCASAATGPLADALASWNHGYCPACGSWPALAEVVNGHRLLRCSFCAAAWELQSYACVYCGESGDGFVTAAPEEDRKNRRLELCSACGAYLKTVDVAEVSPFPLVAIADMETIDFDVAAIEHRYARPPLKGFRTR